MGKQRHDRGFIKRRRHAEPPTPQGISGATLDALARRLVKRGLCSPGILETHHRPTPNKGKP